MTVVLKFEESDFENFRSFEKSVKKQLGPDTYVGSDSLCWYFDYPKELAARLRPLTQSKQLEFELKSSQPDKECQTQSKKNVQNVGKNNIISLPTTNIVQNVEFREP